MVLDAAWFDAREPFALAGDCTASVTIEASRQAATRPVNRRCFPVNIALRIDKSAINNSFIVTDILACNGASSLIQWDLDESWANLWKPEEFGRKIATYDGRMRRIAIVCAGLLAISSMSLVPSTAVAPTSVESVAYKYRSCSYPKGKPGEYKPNTSSWKAQGFTDVVKGIDISVWQHPDEHRESNHT
jgi:hypothetical protein